MAYKGRYIPKNPSKYVADPTKITYRSMWEKKFMVFCDTNESVLRWGSETIVVPYKSPVDGKMHRYFVDFIVETINKRGFKETQLIEIKPKKQTKEPVKKSRVSRRYLYEVKTYAVNQAKWKSATEFAENRGWTFKIFTEEVLFPNGNN
jgi:hypothetical protein